ncbi:MAG TPA: hypothetical protein VF829_03610 [Candidatus Paceibacterota bacterium]
MHKEYPPRTTANRSQEEDGLRAILKQLEEEARYQHGAEADRTEQKILATEKELKVAEGNRPRIVPTPEPIPAPSADSSKTETEGERAERMNRLRKLEILRAAQASRKEPPAPEPTFFDETPIDKPEAPEDPVVAAKAAHVAQERKEKREENEARQFALRADVDREYGKVVGARAAYLRAHRMNMEESIVQQRKREYDEVLAAFAAKINKSAEQRLDGERLVREGTEFEASDREINAKRTLDAKSRAKLDQHTTETKAFVSMKEDLPASKEMEDAEAVVTGLNARFAKVEAAQDPYRREKVLERYGRRMAFRENARLNDRLHAAKERIRAEAEALDEERADVHKRAQERLQDRKRNRSVFTSTQKGVPIAATARAFVLAAVALLSPANTAIESVHLSDSGDFLAEEAVLGQKLSQEHVVAPVVAQSAPEVAQTKTTDPEAKAESGATRAVAAIRNMYRHALSGKKEIAKEPEVEAKAHKGKAHKGEGADALFADLQQKLRKLYPDPMKAPEEVRHLLGENPDAFSIEHGFEKGQQSAVIQIGDSFVLKDGKLTFKTGGDEIVLEAIENGRLVKGSTFDHMPGHHYKQSFHFTPTEQETLAPVKAAPVEAPVQKAAPIATSAATAPAPEATPVQRSVEGTDWTSEEKKETVHLEKTPATGSANVGGYEWDGDEKYEDVYTAPARTAQAGPSTPAPAPRVESPAKTVAPEAHASAPVTETVTAPTMLHQEFHPLLNSEEVETYRNKTVSDVLFGSPEVPASLRDRLLETIRVSGLGPANGEKMESFLSRVHKAGEAQGKILRALNGASVPTGETHVYATDGFDTVYGGSPEAQHIIAEAYGQTHPGQPILAVSAIDGKIHKFTFSASVRRLQDNGMWMGSINVQNFLGKAPRGGNWKDTW